jgi:3-phenylpropionate/trans-cinnamate dioxygenase ferredoxin subunit
MKWFKVAESIEEVTQRGDRNIVEITVASRQICLVFSRQQLFGCTAKCPHAGAKLSHGFIDAQQNIVCPLHKYRYQLSNGYNSSGEGFHLKTFPVKINEDGVYVGIS